MSPADSAPAAGLQRVREWRNVDAALFRNEIQPLEQPAVLKGLVSSWPAVRAGAGGDAAMGAYIRQFDTGGQAQIMVGAPEIKGRLFYLDDMSGVNFEKFEGPFAASIDRILAHRDDAEPPSLYMGSARIAGVAPEFARDNAIDLVGAEAPPRIWIGNAVTVATHFDMSENIACVVHGARRFTLFPPDQFPNLYVGPLEFTFAGQPVSMASVQEPDFAKHPRFRDALAVAQQADLEPGDAIYMPYMWWHNVQSLERFNVLVNYWWDDEMAWTGSPFETLVHGLLTIKHMRGSRREIWRKVFDHYVFQTGGDPVAHLAPAQRGIQGAMTPQLGKYMRSWLARWFAR